MIINYENHEKHWFCYKRLKLAVKNFLTSHKKVIKNSTNYKNTIKSFSKLSYIKLVPWANTEDLEILFSYLVKK